jgi:predicted permease
MVAVISDRLWRQWFGCSRDVLGRPLRVNDVTFTIVGVAPAGFGGVGARATPSEIWLPDRTIARLYPLRPSTWVIRHNVHVFVRVTAEAQTATAAVMTRMLVASREGPPSGLVTIEPADRWLRRSLNGAAEIAFGLALLVLFGASCNYAQLLLARATTRLPELSVRLSVGASRVQVARLLTIESLTLGAAATIVGAALALVAAWTFGAAFPFFRPARGLVTGTHIALDYRVLVVAACLGVASSLIVGLLCAWRITRVSELYSFTRTASARASAWRSGPVLVALQVAAGLLLVMGAGLFLENLSPDLDLKLRFDASQLGTIRVDFGQADYDVERERRFASTLIQSGSQVPGLVHAAFASSLPGGVDQAAPTSIAITADGREGPNGVPRRIAASYSAVSPTFFATLGIRLLAGRELTQWDDVRTDRVAILSRSAAQVLFRDGLGLGRKIQFGFGGPWLTVVGIVEDPLTGYSPEAPFRRPANFLFVPLDQLHTSTPFLVVRSAAPLAMLDAVRTAAMALDPDVALGESARLDETFLASLAPPRAAFALIASIAVTALAISMLGVYGMLSFVVSRCQHEFGVRLAVGATPRQIMKLVMDRAVHVALVGLLMGVFVGTISSRVLEATIYQLMPNAILTWTLVPLFMLATAVLAAYLPARRAARIDPVICLRVS